MDGIKQIMRHRVKKIKNKLSLRITVVFYWLIILQVLDGIFTAYGVSQYGIHVEGNPLISNLIQLYGILILVPIKLMAILAIILIVKVHKFYKFNWIESLPIYLLFVIYYIVVMIWALAIGFEYYKLN